METQKQRPVSVYLATTDAMLGYLTGLTANDCDVQYDAEAGTVLAYDDDALVYQALQKGVGGPWIIACFNSDRITWAPKTEPLFLLQIQPVDATDQESWKYVTDMGAGDREDAKTFTWAQAERFIEFYAGPDVDFHFVPI